MAGHLVESLIGYKLKGVPTVEVMWFPERKDEPEIDYVITLGVKRIPIEIKYQKTISSQDWAAAEAFCSKPHYEAPFGIIVTQEHAGKVGNSCVAVPAANLLLAL
jgi:predicted AAA+ superfamily ATPase